MGTVVSNAYCIVDSGHISDDDNYRCCLASIVLHSSDRALLNHLKHMIELELMVDLMVLLIGHLPPAPRFPVESRCNSSIAILVSAK